jgi:hypothetical protein
VPNERSLFRTMKTLTITGDGAALHETYLVDTDTETIITRSFKLTKADVKHFVRTMQSSFTE